MKKLIVPVMLAVFLFSILAGSALAAGVEMKPCVVKVKTNYNENFAKFQGLKVRVNEKKDEFFSHNFFISLDDVMKLAKLRGVKCSLDKKANLLLLGEKKLEIVKTDPKSKEEFFFKKIRTVNYKGKMYFDTWTLFGGLGFDSISKLNDGVSYFDKKMEKKKK